MMLELLFAALLLAGFFVCMAVAKHLDDRAGALGRMAGRIRMGQAPKETGHD